MIKLNIEKIGYGGKGIGRLDGKICFVENALPGETVEIEILKDKKNFIEAKAIQIENPSPQRETPLCVYNDTCGGCQYQHMSYTEEVRWKEIQIRESLQKQLQLPDELFLPMVPNSSPYGYRNHITLHRAGNGWGFVDEDNESMVPIEKCLIAHDDLNAVLKDPDVAYNNRREERITIRRGAGGKVVLSTEDTFFNIPMPNRSNPNIEPQLCDTGVHDSENLTDTTSEVATVHLGGGSGNLRIRTHSRCFFQNNLEMTLKIAEKIHALYETTSPDHFWDLYSGVGTFTVLVNPRKSQVLCVENHPKGIEALEMNLKNLGLAGEIAPEPVEDCLHDILQEARTGKVLAILDPPKVGLASESTRALTSGKGPDTLAYISCHMGALARDLKSLTEGAYKIESVQAFDMFPRTKHIETLVILKKK